MAAPTGITMGDPAGIGPEIVARLFAETAPAAVVFGDAGAMRRAVRMVGAALAVRTIGAVADASCATCR